MASSGKSTTTGRKINRGSCSLPKSISLALHQDKHNSRSSTSSALPSSQLLSSSLAHQLTSLLIKMKATFFTLFAIGGFIASSIANPIAVADSVKRQDANYDAIEASLTTLLSNIQAQTAIISK
jgi:hypothetical protein